MIDSAPTLESACECIAALELALGAQFVSQGDAINSRHLVDWSGASAVTPLALVRPATPAEVASVMRICYVHRIAVVPQGGMTGLAGGAIPAANAIALSLDRLNVVEELNPKAGTITVQAGVTLQAVQEAAASAGLVVGVDLGARGSCQMGGAIATNAGGNGVVQFGMMRDQTLGLEVVLADGTVLSMLRPMIKNNTGYDLKHWFVGSEGTLGIITRAILKAHPAPSAKVSALIALTNYGSAVQLLRLLQSRFPGCLAAFELMWDDFVTTSLRWSGQTSPLSQSYPLLVLVEITGSEEQTVNEHLLEVLGQAMEEGTVADAIVAQSQTQAMSLWRIREATAEFPTHMQPVNFDVSLPIEHIGEFADECIHALSLRWPGQESLRFGHLGDGNLHLTTDLNSLQGGLSPAVAMQEVEAIVYGLLQKRGGSISAEHGIGLHKKPYLQISRTPAEFAVMRAIKQSLDPLNLLNPGKLFDIYPQPENHP